MNDLAIIGAGIVGLATAYTWQSRFPGARVVVIEKEAQVGAHQTGHNSGVIHAGVYYEPGSLKAQLCRAGSLRTSAFCAEHGVAFERCGKLIVATGDDELDRLRALHARAQRNGAETRWLDRAELRTREPNIVGVAALWVAETGIVDYPAMAAKLAELIGANGGEVHLNQPAERIIETPQEAVVETARTSWHTQHLVVCAGLQADRLARLAGLEIDFAIIPFRGDYYRLPAAHAGLIRHLIYPVPDPQLPFLGVHLTRMIDGGITVGPSAMLAFKREGYAKTDVDFTDLAEMARFGGLWRLLARYPRAGLMELGCALSRRLYLRAVHKYCPGLALSDLLPNQSGVRAQAVGRDGSLIHDFVVKDTRRMTHLCNAPSPAATAALPIAGMIVDRIHQRS